MIWNNLSQCADMEGRKCYLRSTDVEQMHWRRLLWSVPDELLFELAAGRAAEIVDISKKRAGKIERIFCPVFMDVLFHVWFDEPPISTKFRAHYQAALRELEADTLLRSRYEYWGRLLPDGIALGVRTIQVPREPNPL